MLFVGAAVVSGGLQTLLTAQMDALYLLWFAVCLIPFLLFARRRGALDCSNRGILLLLVYALVIGLIGATRIGNEWLPVIGVVLGVPFVLALRRIDGVCRLTEPAEQESRP